MSTMQKILCPHCGKEVELTEAFRHEMEAVIVRETEEKLTAQITQKTSGEIDELKKELQEKNKKVDEMRAQELQLRQKSRELGDRENGYYSASRQKVNAIDARLRKLKFMIKYALIIESKDTNEVDINTTVLLKDGDREFEYTIVGEEEANPQEAKISYRSPLGSALLGKKAGDSVEFNAPAGTKLFKILKLS